MKPDELQTDRRAGPPDAILQIPRLQVVSEQLSHTQALVEALADPGQYSQGDEVSEAGSNGRGYIVWVNSRLL